MAETQTFDSFIVQQIMPAAGWQAVWYLAEDQAHLVESLSALALAYRVTRECHTRRLIPSPYPQEEMWEVVGLVYAPGEPWTVCDAIGNYCGLLPPGMPLATFMQSSLCRHVHPQAAECVALVEKRS